MKHYQPHLYEYPKFDATFRRLLADAEAAAEAARRPTAQPKTAPAMTNGQRVSLFTRFFGCLEHSSQQPCLRVCRAASNQRAAMGTGMHGSADPWLQMQCQPPAVRCMQQQQVRQLCTGAGVY